MSVSSAAWRAFAAYGPSPASPTLARAGLALAMSPGETWHAAYRSGEAVDHGALVGTLRRYGNLVAGALSAESSGDRASLFLRLAPGRTPFLIGVMTLAAGSAGHAGPTGVRLVCIPDPRGPGPGGFPAERTPRSGIPAHELSSDLTLVGYPAATTGLLATCILGCLTVRPAAPLLAVDERDERRLADALDTALRFPGR